jgi:hypothetical protein
LDKEQRSYYRTFFRSFQSVLLSGLIRDEPIGVPKEVLSASTGGLREEPIVVPNEVLSSGGGASVSRLSAHTREKEDEDFLVVSIDPGIAAAAEEEDKNALI